MPLAYTPITPTTSVETGLSALVSSGIHVVAGSVTYAGGTNPGTEQGSFFTGGSAIGVASGLLLTTGDGTPPTSNTETGYTGSAGGPGDADLQTVVSGVFSGNVTTADANVLEFDVEITDANVASLKFTFVFGSDEFPEFSTSHPDIAGIFVDGTDRAFFANGKPLSVIQQNVDDGFFINNSDGHLGVEYDGVSTALSLNVAVSGGVGSIHHVKIALADTGDSAVDSGLFVQSVSGTNGVGGVITGPPPIGVDDVITVAEDRTSVVVPAKFTGSLLANDLPGVLTDVLSIVAVDGAAAQLGTAIAGDFGTLVVKADGTYSYSVLNTDKLIKGETGHDTFHYMVSDGHGGTDTATISFTITGDDLDVFEDGQFVAHRGDDQIKGGDQADSFAGRNGDDTLLGNGNADTLWGQAGNDKIFGGSGSDRGIGGDGDDTLTLGSGDDTGWGGVGNDTLLGNAGRDYLIGEDGDDTVDGGAGDDTIQGLAGTDDLAGGAGSDRIWGGADNDALRGNKGADQLAGGAGDDTAFGGNGADKIWGDGGNDSLAGGGGHDQLTGGAGDDRLFLDAGADDAWGGDGNDRFIFTPGFGDDHVKDFNPGDTIVFAGVFSGWADLKAHMSDNGDNVFIHAGAGNTVTVEHVGALHQGDFLFA